MMHSFEFQGDCDPSFGSEFVFSAHSKELIVGEIFVRIYNQQPTFPLEVCNRQHFTDIFENVVFVARVTNPSPFYLHFDVLSIFIC